MTREAKFKRALRVHFLTHFTKNVCHFLTPKVKNGTDMINQSIESSDFLFWHEKFLIRFLKILWETDKVHFTSSNLICVYTHPQSQNMKFSLCVSHKIFKHPTPIHVKIQNQSFRLIG